MLFRKRTTGRKTCAFILALIMTLTAAIPGAAPAVAEGSGSAVLVSWAEPDVRAEVNADVSITLIVEGLGTDPADNQVASVAFVSDDPTVVSSFTVGSPSAYTPSGASEPTGLVYAVTAPILKTGATSVTTTVTDTDGGTHTRVGTDIGNGIAFEYDSITLEVDEACVLFANRYGFTNSQARQNLSWSKTNDAGTDPDWIERGNHATNRQYEAAYVKGLAVGTGTVTVSLVMGGNTVYSDTIRVTVVPKKAVTIEQSGTEVTSTIDLSSTSSATLTAVTEGFTSPTVTWESSHPDLVSLSSSSGSTVTVTAVGRSAAITAVKATVTEGDVVRVKTVYVKVPGGGTPIKIAGSGGLVSITQGDKVQLQLTQSSDASKSTVWSVTTDGGRVPVKLLSTVGRTTVIEGRLPTNTPVTVTAQNGPYTDIITVEVTPNTTSGYKSVRITGDTLRSDGVIVMQPDDVANLTAELTGFSGTPTVTWSIAHAKNDRDTSAGATSAASLSTDSGTSTTLTALAASTDYAKVTVSVTSGGTTYTDEIFVYVKANATNIVTGATFITLPKSGSVVLSTANGEPADWYSWSQKTYLGGAYNSDNTSSVIGSATAMLKTGNTTSNPSRILVTQNGVTETLYVYVQDIGGTTAASASASTAVSTVSFNLNGGYGTAPNPMRVAATDEFQSIVLPDLYDDVAYPDDEGAYEFYGWSESRTAAEPNSDALIYLPGQTYNITSSAVTLYAIWTKSLESALFVIRLSEDIGAEPAQYDANTYSPSGIYLEDALSPAGFYFNVNGVESHLAKTPSATDIGRALAMKFEGGSAVPVTYDEEHDQVIWYVIKRISNDAAGLPNWHVDGVLLKGSKSSLTYDKNLSVANLQNFPNPPRAFHSHGEVVNITENVPTSTDSVFIGWNTERDGSGQWYSSTGSLTSGFEPPAGETVETQITLDGDVVLYAMWTGVFLHAEWTDGAVLPDELHVTFMDKDYVLNDNNEWMTQVTNLSLSDLTGVPDPDPLGYEERTRRHIMTGTGGLRCVTYTMTIGDRVYDYLERQIELTDGTRYAVLSNVSEQIAEDYDNVYATYTVTRNGETVTETGAIHFCFDEIVLGDISITAAHHVFTDVGFTGENEFVVCVLFDNYDPATDEITVEFSRTNPNA